MNDALTVSLQPVLADARKRMAEGMAQWFAPGALPHIVPRAVTAAAHR